MAVQNINLLDAIRSVAGLPLPAILRHQSVLNAAVDMVAGGSTVNEDRDRCESLVSSLTRSTGNMSVSVVVKNGATTIGEGPHWEESTQSLLYVDFMNGYVHRWNPTTGQDDKLHLSKTDESVSLIVPCDTGGYIVTIGRTINHLDWETGTVTQLAQVDKGPNAKFNDGKCDDKGRLWAGTIDILPGQPGVGSLYTFDKENTMRTHLDNINLSNGIAWSLDNKTMYYIDSLPGKVFAFDFDLENGTIDTDTQRTVLDCSQCKTHSLGLPDGMTIDTEGKLWVACFGDGKVVRLDPETGSIMREVPIPTKQPSSCCFGGQNYDELYVTSARTYLADDVYQTEGCIAGSVFKVSGLGVKGLPANTFGGAQKKN